MRRIEILAIALASLPAVSGCAISGSSPPEPTCDQACQDGVAIRALRTGMAQLYNAAFPQPLPPGVTPPEGFVPPPWVPSGPQDLLVPCDATHVVHLFGDATSDPTQGVTMVNLTYQVPGCLSENKNDPTPEGNYGLVITGTLTEVGTLGGNRTNALVIRGDGVSLSGTVFDPAYEYDELCDLDFVQNGGNVSGRLCGRAVGYGQ
jgi:hypothetical protein